MVKIIISLVSVILSFALLRIGYEVEDDYLSIGLQIAGYIVISYPFYMFFKLLIGKIKYDLKRYKTDKIFYTQKGVVYGHVYVGSRPLRNVKCVVKNTDKSLHKWSHKWIGLTDNDGYFEIKFIPDGEYICQFTHTFLNGNDFVIDKEFKIVYGDHKEMILEIKEK